ncbi:MAG: glycerol-3-phosphate responsive antiterminator [Treponema sp.]|nr:glycerol-3-phosphate responsive antiterminator [Treponema sp.]
MRKKHIPRRDELYDLLHKTPVIPAVKSSEGLRECLGGDSGIVFVLFGDILTIPGIVAKIKEAGKLVLVHADLIDGLTSRDVAADFLEEHTGADGILSIKPNLIKHAKSRGLLTIQRFFVLDSMSLFNIEKQFPLEYADAIEILPGLMPKIIRKISDISKKPVIAGGLISEREDVRLALEAGAVSVSTTNSSLIRN